MAKKGKGREKIKLKSSESPHFYTATKGKGATEKLEIKKYDPVIRRHTVYKEAKMK